MQLHKFSSAVQGWIGDPRSLSCLLPGMFINLTLTVCLPIPSWEAVYLFSSTISPGLVSLLDPEIYNITQKLLYLLFAQTVWKCLCHNVVNISYFTGRLIENCHLWGQDNCNCGQKWIQLFFDMSKLCLLFFFFFFFQFFSIIVSFLTFYYLLLFIFMFSICLIPH